MIPSPKLITLGCVWDLRGVENSDHLQLSAETVDEVVPAAVHAVEDEEDVEDNHLDDHIDDHLDNQVAMEVNFKEDVKDDEDQQAEHEMIIIKIKIIRKKNQQAEHDLQARSQLEEPHTAKISESHLKKRKVFKYNL